MELILGIPKFRSNSLEIRFEIFAQFSKLRGWDSYAWVVSNDDIGIKRCEILLIPTSNEGAKV